MLAGAMYGADFQCDMQYPGSKLCTSHAVYIYICIFISILSLLLRTIGLKSETFGTRWLRDGKILSRTDDYIFIFNILVVSRGKENECFKYVLIEKR